MSSALNYHKNFKLWNIYICLLLLLTSACVSVDAQEQLPKGLQEAEDSSTVFLPITKTPTTTQTLTLQSEFGIENTHRVITDGIFAIWWHPDYDQFAEYDLTKEAVELAAALNDVRTDSLKELGLKDPPNLAAGAYVNVYIHDPDLSSTDNFPNWWGNGVGTNSFDVPYMTLPIGAHVDQINVAHEGFHIFQYSATNDGYEYAGDSAWFIEASANWYAVHKFHDTSDAAFVEAAIIKNLPFVTMWRSWDNAAPGDPQNWQREVHQYAMHTWLFYLTEIRGIDTDIMTAGYYADTDEMPQEYMYRRIPNMRQLYGDWAAANVAEFSYLTRAQWARAQEEVEWVADPTDLFPNIATLGQEGTDGAWITPPADQAPRGWSYNVIEINITDGPYTIEFQGNPTGSEGTNALFEARVVFEGSDGFRQEIFDLKDGLTGELTLEAFRSDSKMFVVIVAVPEAFEGTQTYPYQVKIMQ